MLLPVVAVLSGIGLAFITRLDAELAGQQVLWLFVGVGVLVATLALVPSLERLARYKYTIMLAGIVLLVLPAVIGREVNGAKLWLRIARRLVPALRGRQDPHRAVPRRLPRREPRGPLGLDAPRARRVAAADAPARAAAR